MRAAPVSPEFYIQPTTRPTSPQCLAPALCTTRCYRPKVRGRVLRSWSRLEFQTNTSGTLFSPKVRSALSCGGSSSVILPTVFRRTVLVRGVIGGQCPRVVGVSDWPTARVIGPCCIVVTAVAPHTLGQHSHQDRGHEKSSDAAGESCPKHDANPPFVSARPR